VVLGLFGLVFKPLASSRFLTIAAACALAATPLAIWAAWRVMPSLTCRAGYSTHDRWCPEGDPLGGTSGQITNTAVFVTVVLTGLLLASALRARESTKRPIAEPS
jgi:hypothetical protein